MEKELIIKALECCGSKHSDIGKYSCKECPLNGQNFDEGACYDEVLHNNALALIKELTEECEKLKSIGISKDIVIESLAEENERLKNICNSYALQYGTARDKEVFLRKERADTVREMQERFKELMGNEIASCGFCNAEGYWSIKKVKESINRAANEMLNKNTEECTSCKHFVGCECFDGKVCDLYEKK